MKRGITIILIMIFLMPLLFSEQINFSFDFQNTIKQKSYDFYNDSIGLPVIHKNIIINNRIIINNIRIDYSKDSIISKINCKNNNYIYSLNNNKSILLSSPKKHYKINSISYLGNNTVISIDFFPFIFKDNNFLMINKFNINIQYTLCNKQSPTSPLDIMFKIPNSKDNYNIKIQNKKAQKQSTLDLLIITSNAFADSVEQLKTITSLLGLRSEIKTIENISIEYNGVDLPEKIRNYIIDKYYSLGIRFVILCGDVDVIPTRYVYNNNFYYYGYIATDTYYADIDGSWNGDGDELIGNLQTDSIDAYPDIAVGRLPFSNFEEFNVLMKKTYNYIFNNDFSNMQTLLLCGASILESLSDGLGQKMNDKIAGLENNNQNIFKLYSPISDTFNDFPAWSNGNDILSKSSFISNIANYHFINHVDHADASWFGTGFYAENSFILHPDSFDFYSNNIYSIMFSLGCSSNAFDKETMGEVFMLSSNSPITFYTGFTRTGWTNAENTMIEYWNTMLNKNTFFVGQALINASLYANQYFRITLNNLGIPILPAYNKIPKMFSINAPDTINSGDFITINVSDGTYAVYNACVIVYDGENYFRDSTDLAGNVKFDACFGDSFIVFCVNAPSFLPYIDTIYIKNRSIISIDTIFATYSKDSLKVKIINNTDTIIRNLLINTIANDSLFSVNDILNVKILRPDSFTIITFPIEYKKSPIHSTLKNILFSYKIQNKTINIYNSIYLQKDSFLIRDFYIDTLSSLKINKLKIINNINQKMQNVKISINTDSFTIVDSVFIKDFEPFDTILLTDIAVTDVYEKQTLLDAEYRITINAYSREYVYYIKGMENSNRNLLYEYKMDGLYLYHRYKNTKAIIFKSDDGIKFQAIDTINYNKYISIQKNFSNPFTYFYASFYDKANRFIGNSPILKINTFFNSSLSSTRVSGSFYGKLNNRRFYAKSSFNCADLNNDGLKELVVLSDDGKLIILDNQLNNITPIKINVSSFNEYSPAIGLIDNNDYPDIVIGGGAFSDTSALIILNPFNNPKIISIEKMGELRCAPVIADISEETGKEILLGTTTGFFVFNTNGQEIVSFRKLYRNITSIAVNDNNNFIVFTDYYGKVYAIDNTGNMIEGFPFNTQEIILSPILLCDFNLDNSLDIIIATAYGSIFVINQYGQLLPNFPINDLNPFYQSPKVEDINKDGNMEIIIMDLKGIINIFNENGLIASYNTNDTKNNTYNEPLIGDIDYDNEDEIVVFNRSGYLHILDAKTLKLEKTIIKNNYEITSTPILLNNSEKMYFVFKDINGNIVKIEFVKDPNTKISPSIDYGKTLVNKENTSFISTSTFSKLKTIQYDYNNDYNEYININYSLNGGYLNINYLLKNKGHLKIINKIGQCVYKTILNKDKKHIRINFHNLNIASGEYFLIANYSNNKTIKKRFLFFQ